MDFIQQLFLFRVSLHAVFGAADAGAGVLM